MTGQAETEVAPCQSGICVCADDYGLHEGIDRAALGLARGGRVTAISCMVGGPSWDSGCDALKEHTGAVDVGLHLNFTEGFAGIPGVLPLQRLILAAYVRRLKPAAIRSDIERQLDAFERDMGRMPDFVDGHQHVHQLPIIRDMLIAALDQRYRGRKPWVRVCAPPASGRRSELPSAIRWKSSIIGWLGARALRHLAQAHGYAQNRRLLGVYGFDASEDSYLRLLGSWLRGALDGDLLMCHPAVAGRWEDPLLEARHREYRVLSGEAFASLLGSTGVVIKPLRDVVGRES